MLTVVILEDGKELQTSSEVCEVVPQCRQLEVLASFQLRDGRLADPKLGGKVDLRTIQGTTQLVESDLGQGLVSKCSKSFRGTGARGHLLVEFAVVLD
jgi:hypothetical protein